MRPAAAPLLLAAFAVAASAQTITLNGQPTNRSGAAVFVTDAPPTLCYSFPTSGGFQAGEKVCYGVRGNDVDITSTCISMDGVRSQACISTPWAGFGSARNNVRLFVRQEIIGSRANTGAQILSQPINMITLSFSYFGTGKKEANSTVVRIDVLSEMAPRINGPVFVNMYDAAGNQAGINPIDITAMLGVHSLIRRFVAIVVPKSVPTKGPYTMRVFGPKEGDVLFPSVKIEKAPAWSNLGL